MTPHMENSFTWESFVSTAMPPRDPNDDDDDDEDDEDDEDEEDDEDDETDEDREPAVIREPDENE